MSTFEQVAQEQRKRKRVFARSLFPMDREVGYREMATRIGGEKKGVLHSISQSGLFVRSKDIPQIGTQLAINFFFGQEKIRCEGTVIYRNPTDDGINAQGFGMKFTKMLTKDYEAIKQSVDQFFQM